MCSTDASAASAFSSKDLKGKAMAASPGGREAAGSDCQSFLLPFLLVLLLRLLGKTLTLFAAPTAYPIVDGRLSLCRDEKTSIGAPPSILEDGYALLFLRPLSLPRPSQFSPLKVGSDCGCGRRGDSASGKASHSPRLLDVSKTSCG